jgi:hypothetical protein
VKSAREWAEPLYRRKPTPWGTDVVEVTAYVADIERAIRAAQLDALRAAREVCVTEAQAWINTNDETGPDAHEAAVACADRIAALAAELES